jgi:hypothetical protein
VELGNQQQRLHWENKFSGTVCKHLFEVRTKFLEHLITVYASNQNLFQNLNAFILESYEKLIENEGRFSFYVLENFVLAMRFSSLGATLSWRMVNEPDDEDDGEDLVARSLRYRPSSALEDMRQQALRFLESSDPETNNRMVFLKNFLLQVCIFFYYWRKSLLQEKFL